MSAYLHLQNIPLEEEKPGVVGSLNRKIRLVWQNNPLYSWSLAGRGGQDLFVVPTDPWPGSLTEGRNIVEGKFVLGHEACLLQHLWHPKHLSPSALAELHSFEWLRNLRSMGENSARRVARQLITSWIDRNQNWRSFAWRPDVVGQRLSNWIGLYDFFCASADDTFRSQFFKSLFRQTRHLSRSWMNAPTVAQKLFALHGLIHAIICLDHEAHRLPGLMRHLSKIIEQQILSDGGHISRSPILQLTVLRLLIDLKSLLRQVNHEIPSALHKAIQKMAPIVRLFRHGDGGIACFGPYQKISGSMIDMVLTLADVRGRPPLRAEKMGYERCQSRTGLVLVNTLPTPLRSPCNNIEEGTGLFTFEWSTAKRRIITYADVVMQSDRGLYAKAGVAQHCHLDVRGTNHKEGVLLETEYQNHQPTWSFSQNRSLFLSHQEQDFRGEDLLVSHLPAFFAIRFVFHPELRVTHHGRKIYIDSPDGHRWICLTTSDEMHIEQLETSYPSQMLLLMGHLSPNQTRKIRWAFRSEG